jgi:hypothetical protein
MSVSSVLTGTPATTTLTNKLTTSVRYSCGSNATALDYAVPANATGSPVPNAYVASANSPYPVGSWAFVTVSSSTVNNSTSILMTAVIEVYQNSVGTPLLNVFDTYSSNPQFFLGVTGGNTLAVWNRGTSGGGSATDYIIYLSSVVQPVLTSPPIA